MIATVSQVVHRIDDRKSGTYVCLKQELNAAMAGCFLQFDIIAVGRRGGYLIGCHYRYVIIEQCFV